MKKKYRLGKIIWSSPSRSSYNLVQGVQNACMMIMKLNELVALKKLKRKVIELYFRRSKKISGKYKSFIKQQSIEKRTLYKWNQIINRATLLNCVLINQHFFLNYSKDPLMTHKIYLQDLFKMKEEISIQFPLVIFRKENCLNI